MTKIEWADERTRSVPIGGTFGIMPARLASGLAHNPSDDGIRGLLFRSLYRAASGATQGGQLLQRDSRLALHALHLMVPGTSSPHLSNGDFARQSVLWPFFASPQQTFSDLARATDPFVEEHNGDGNIQDTWRPTHRSGSFPCRISSVISNCDRRGTISARLPASQDIYRPRCQFVSRPPSSPQDGFPFSVSFQIKCTHPPIQYQGHNQWE